MIKILLIAAILFLLVLFISQLKNYLVRDKKVAELKDARLKTHMLEIDKEIAEEKARQNDKSSEINEINSQQQKSSKDDQ